MTIYSKQITDLARGIAHAEGFGVPNTVPTRAHNPGDIKVPYWTGPTTGTEGITVFESDDEGWKYLYDQLLRIQIGHSHVYNLKMTFKQFSEHWTDTQETSWINNVIYKLQSLGYQVTTETTLGDYFASDNSIGS